MTATNDAFLSKPRRFRVGRVLADFAVIDTHLGPASLVPGDVVLLDVVTREEVPVRRQDLVRDFIPLTLAAAELYDAAVARVDRRGPEARRAENEWCLRVLDGALRTTHPTALETGTPTGPICPARIGSDPHQFEHGGTCACGAVAVATIPPNGHVVGELTVRPAEAWQRAAAGVYRHEAGQLAAIVEATRDPRRVAISTAMAAVAHWNEFGPEHGFSEDMDRLDKALDAYRAWRDGSGCTDADPCDACRETDEGAAAEDLVERIGRVCHETQRAYCASIGETLQPWDEAPEWQRATVRDGVKFHLANPAAGPAGSHANWMEAKLREGWVWGPVKRPETLQHPCLVPFEQLPPQQQAKDALFVAVVHSMGGRPA